MRVLKSGRVVSCSSDSGFVRQLNLFSFLLTNQSMSNDISSSLTPANTFSEGLKDLFHFSVILILLFI